jgi:hypothetical protein
MRGDAAISRQSMSYDAHHSPGGLVTSAWRLPSTSCGKCVDTLLEGSTRRPVKFECSLRALTRLPRLTAGVMAMGVSCEEKASSRMFVLVCRMKSPSRDQDR